VLGGTHLAVVMSQTQNAVGNSIQNVAVPRVAFSVENAKCAWNISNLLWQLKYVSPRFDKGVHFAANIGG